MPIDIAHYQNWATQHANTEVAIRQGNPELEQASNQVGFFARFFNTSSAKNARQAVMTDFTRTLSAKYGATLAQQALKDVGLSPASKLVGSTISAVIDRANNLRANALAHAGAADLRLKTGTITQADIGGYGDVGREYVQNYLTTRMLAIDALGEMPLDADSLQDFRERVASIKTALTAAANQANLPLGVSDKFPREATALIAALDAKVAETETLLEGRPLSETNIQHYKTVWHDASIKALNTLKGETQKTALRTAIDAVINSINTNPAGFDASIPVAKDGQKELAKVLLRMIKDNVQGGKAEFTEKSVAKTLLASYCQTLNERPWPTISKTFTAAIGNTPVTLKSEIVPGARIGATDDNATGPIGRTYDHGVNGYMCHSAHTQHAVNLAVSSLSIDDADEPAFRGIRHGVHSAWEIANPQDRAEANVNRAKETVIAAFLADPANAQRIQNGEINILMTSVSLLTPDSARHTFQKGGVSDECQMLMEQKAAWDTVARDGVTFQYNGQNITIRPQIFTFNLGVNAGAVKYSGIAPDIAGGWTRSAEMNHAAHEALHAHVQAFVNNTAIPEKTRNAVKTLFNQCAAILNAGGERKDGHDAYKVAARYAVLTYLMGGTPCWNCKSGKDRTGQMDVECKFLAALIARGEEIPEPGAKLTKAQQGLFRAIAFEGGNFEMQRQNTGFAGFKTGGVSSIPERLGGQEYRNFHKGGSDFVKV